MSVRLKLGIGVLVLLSTLWGWLKYERSENRKLRNAIAVGIEKDEIIKNLRDSQPDEFFIDQLLSDNPD